MTNIDIKQAVDKVADGEISTADASFVKGQMDIINKDKTTNHFQEFIKVHKTSYEQTKNCIAESLNNYIKSEKCDDKVLPEVKDFITRLQNESNVVPKEIVKPGNETAAVTAAENTEVKYDADKPLESMLLTINENLKQAKIEDKKLIQTPEQIKSNAEKIRNNLKDGIMKQVEVELKTLLKINDKKIDNDYDNKKEAIYKFLYESFANELNTGKRVENLVVGGLYVTINGIKQKMDAPNKENMKDFNLVGANILSNVKDINTLLSANGNVMDNLFKNSQDKIVKKIKTTFPREAITKMTEQELNTELGNIKQKGFYINLGKASNPVTEVFSKDITIDSELAAIQFIESNNGLPKTTKEQLGGEGGAEAQKDLTKKLKDILGEVPTNTYEKEAFKTELIQNKFSGWSKSLLETIYTLAQKRGLGDLLGMFNKDGLFDKVLLSKSRNDAMIARELYDKTKSKDTKLVEVKIKNFTTNISHTTIVETLNNCKKFISPVMSSNGKEADDKKRSELFMKGDSYDPTLVKAQFDGYVKLLGEKWENPISRVVEKDKVKTEKTYSYKDLITSDADLVEHFMQYVQTGQMPDGYSDKTIYESMKDLGKIPEVKTSDTKTPDQAPATNKDNANNPVKVEAPIAEKPREKAANDFATSVNAKPFKSNLWTDSYAVEYVVNGKKAVKMFKSPTAKRISK